MTERVIKALAPFDFAATARFIRYSEAETVDTFRDQRYRRVLHFNERPTLINVEARGTDARPALSVSLISGRGGNGAATNLAVAAVRRIFSVEHDLTEFRARISRDPFMREIEAAHRGLRLARWPSLFEALVISILGQQISTAVARTLKGRLAERFGETVERGGELFRAFPRAATLAQTNVETLRTLGLSGAKATSIIELARADVDGRLNTGEIERADNGEIIARLSQLRGIGRWTAEWALLLHFGRTDVFPAGDLALRGIVTKYYKKGAPLTESEVRALARRRWGAWSSYAALYFIAALRAGTITFR